MGNATPETGLRPARVVETHMSTLFFYGDRVFKVRRSVAYGFADFTDLERRRVDCEREVELNRRLAPDVYLGTATVSMGDRAVEHAVVMRRLPHERNLAGLVRRGDRAEVEGELRRVAAALAQFHDGATRSMQIAASGRSAALWQRWQSTEEELGRFVGAAVDAHRYRELTALARRYLEGQAPLFDRRIAEGAVCDGHGDLQAGDVFCLADGPRILDCLEFDDQLRHGDVLADVAFLAEDLERLGAPRAATVLLDEYHDRSRREEPPSLVHFYIGYRAHVRLLVECLRHEQGLTVETGPDAVLELALRHLRAAQPRLVLVGGPPGSGKSTLASWVGVQLGADVLSTDHARREALGESPAPTAIEDRYAAASRTGVYEALLDRARALLRTGRSVVFDATWTSAAMRAKAASVARATSAAMAELRCECPVAERRARIIGRLAAGAGESEATPAVTGALEAAADPWPAAHVVNTSGSLAASRQEALRALEAAWATPSSPVKTGRS